jgi:UPF0755 protein
MTDLSVWTEGGRPARPGKRHRRRRKKDRRGGFAVALALVLVLVVVGGGAALALGAGSKLKDVFHTTSAGDYPGPGSGSVQVEVVSGQSLAQIGRTLKTKGVIKSVEAFLTVANADPDSSSVQPGFYKFRQKMAASDALATLLDPSARIQARVTVREGLRLDEVIALLAKETSISAADLQRAVKKPAQLGLPSYANGHVEGFLFPATYDITPDATAVGVLRQMVSRFKQAVVDDGLQNKDLSPYQLVTLASLLEVEARSSADYARVSRVVRNRIAAGMPLQFDSTIHYIFRDDKRKLTLADLKVNSPYNTYAHTGLPAGPIDNPGDATLKAAANPAAGNWLYFVTTNLETGKTKFTDSYSEFLRFKAEFKSTQ